MSVHIFAIQVEAERLVAAEISDSAAAILLDGGHQVFLGTIEELRKVARRLRRNLVTISRGTGPAVSRHSRNEREPAKDRAATVAPRRAVVAHVA
jgi:hypothetical protein